MVGCVNVRIVMSYCCAVSSHCRMLPQSGWPLIDQWTFWFITAVNKYATRIIFQRRTQHGKTDEQCKKQQKMHQKCYEYLKKPYRESVVRPRCPGPSTLPSIGGWIWLPRSCRIQTRRCNGENGMEKWDEWVGTDKKQRWRENIWQIAHWWEETWTGVNCSRWFTNNNTELSRRTG